MAKNIIGKTINGVKVVDVAYMDGYCEEIYECQENGELVYLSYDEIICGNFLSILVYETPKGEVKYPPKFYDNMSTNETIDNVDRKKVAITPTKANDDNI